MSIPTILCWSAFVILFLVYFEVFSWADTKRGSDSLLRLILLTLVRMLTAINYPRWLRIRAQTTSHFYQIFWRNGETALGITDVWLSGSVHKNWRNMGGKKGRQPACKTSNAGEKTGFILSWHTFDWTAPVFAQICLWHIFQPRLQIANMTSFVCYCAITV